MAAMRRDVNLGLLLLIIAALIMFSGFTVYYQTTFKNISQNYDTKIKELESISKELDSKRNQLNDTSVQLQIKKQKEDDLSKKFTDIKGERDQLDTDRKKLEVDLAGTKVELAAAQADLQNTKTTLAGKLTELADMTIKYNKALNDVANYKKENADLSRRNACLKQTSGASETC